MICSLSVFADTFDSTRTTNLNIQIINMEEKRGGQIIVLLYKSENTWLESNRHAAKIIRPVSSDMDLNFEFRELEYSTAYAIHIIHDQNFNGKMDFQWLPPKPAEGVGVSNNHMRLGPPDYEKARIDLSNTHTGLTIALIY